MLSLNGVTKAFGGTKALDALDFDLRAGEVHVLFGENGAGKTTAINIIAGNLAPDSGAISVQGHNYPALTPRLARKLKIAAVFQEFSLIPTLTVEENLFLGRERAGGGFLRVGEMRREAAALLERLKFDVPIDATVERLSRARKQMVEIAKALFSPADILVLDEPTASITENDVETLFSVIRSLREDGVGVIYVSHRMREIRALADRVTVLRGGGKVGTVNIDDVSEATLVEMMTGRTMGALYPKVTYDPKEVRLEVAGLSTDDGSVNEASLHVRGGEIAGIAGLAGCGKGEVARAVFGLTSIASGTVRKDGRLISDPTPTAMLRIGVCYFPSDRNTEGLALNRPILENASMASLDLPTLARNGWLYLAAERKHVREALRHLGVRPLVIEYRVDALSGGNRQKVMLTRGQLRDIDVFLFDEPTVGVDVGAKAEIYELLNQLVTAGAAIILVSSELPELLNMANRIYVMHAGRIVSELEGPTKTEANVLSAFFGSPSSTHGQPSCSKSTTLPTSPTGAGILKRLTQFCAGGGFVAILVIVAAGIIAAIEPRFFSPLNLLNVGRNTSFLAIVAIGQMFVMIVGGFDLAISAMVAVSSVVTATMMTGTLLHGLPAAIVILLSVVTAVAAGSGVGLLNGLCVAWLRLNPLMVTLAMTSVAAGMTFYVTKGIPIYGMPSVFIETLGRGSVSGIPTIVLVATILATIGWVLQRRTALGRHIYATGGSWHSARVSGVNVGRVLTLVYVLSGAFAAITGVLVTARIGSGQSALSSGLVIESIAAAVIGGVSLQGGSGRVERVVLAALFISIVSNGLNLTRVDSKYQTLVLGVVLIAAVAFDRLLARSSASA
jgi:ribose transport system ATP-binding protein